MGLPIIENLSGNQESIFSHPNSTLVKNQTISRILLHYHLLVHVGPMAAWGPLGCCYRNIQPPRVVYAGPAGGSMQSTEVLRSSDNSALPHIYDRL